MSAENLLDHFAVPQGITGPRPAYAEGSGAVSPNLREGGQPTRAGIDPRHLLIDWETDDNIKAIKVKR